MKLLKRSVQSVFVQMILGSAGVALLKTINGVLHEAFIWQELKLHEGSTWEDRKNRTVRVDQNTRRYVASNIQAKSTHI